MTRPLAVTMLLVTYGTLATAQFSVPLPVPLSNQAARFDDLRARFAARVKAAALSKDTSSSARSAHLLVIRDKLCADVAAAIPDGECPKVLANDSLSAIISNNAPTVERLLGWSFPLGRTRGEIREYLQAAGSDPGIFAQFEANVSDDAAYVATNLVQGLANRLLLSIDHAAVLTKAEGVSAEEREVIESDQASLLKIVLNGGTLVTRVFNPMYATRGTNTSSVVGISLGAGVLGSLTETKSLKASGSATIEVAQSHAIRSFVASGETTAEFLISARVGYAQSETRLISTSSDKRMGFGQLAIGLRKNGALAAIAVVTVVHSRFQELMPRVQVKLSAVR